MCGFLSSYELAVLVLYYSDHYVRRAASESTQNCHRDHPAPSLMETSRVDAAREPENRGNTRNRRYAGLFHLQLQRKFFWSEFWSRHQLPCLDPADEALFGCLMVAPSLERSLVNHSTLEKSWRLTARRLLGWIRVRATKSSTTYWLDLEMDECRDLDDETVLTDSIYIFETTTLLRDMYGLRFGKLLADLLFDNKPFAVGALLDAAWKLSSRAGPTARRWRGRPTFDFHAGTMRSGRPTTRHYECPWWPAAPT